MSRSKKRKREDNNTSKENGCEWDWSDIHGGAVTEGGIAVFSFCKFRMPNLVEFHLSIELSNCILLISPSTLMYFRRNSNSIYKMVRFIKELIILYSSTS